MDFKDDFHDLNLNSKHQRFTYVKINHIVVKFENRGVMLVAAGLPFMGFLSGS